MTQVVIILLLLAVCLRLTARTLRLRAALEANRAYAARLEDVARGQHVDAESLLRRLEAEDRRAALRAVEGGRR